MALPSAVRNRWRAFVQMYGAGVMKQRLWDREFSTGRWDYLDRTTGDVVYGYVQRHLRGGRVLDLGCGSGGTAADLSSESYRSYVGVDISAIAIGRARARAIESGSGERNTFVQSDITTYIPIGKFDVILFRDSLYYVPRPHIRPLLRRYAHYLAEHGVFVVRMSDGAGRYRAIAEDIEQHFDVVEERSFEEPNALVLVFQPARAAQDRPR